MYLLPFFYNAKIGTCDVLGCFDKCNYIEPKKLKPNCAQHKNRSVRIKIYPIQFNTVSCFWARRLGEGGGASLSPQRRR